MASDIFAKIGTIDGESEDAKYAKHIELFGWSWGVNNQADIESGGGGGTGRAAFNDFSFTHNVDKASVNLLLACATGEHIPEVKIINRKTGDAKKSGEEFLIFKMSEVVITSVSPAGGGGGPAQESVSLQCAKIEVEYHPQKPDGSLDAAVFFKYDIKGRAPV